MFKKTLLATSLMMAFGMTAAGAAEVVETITENGTYYQNNNRLGSEIEPNKWIWKPGLTINIADNLDVTLVRTTGWETPNINAEHSNVTFTSDGVSDSPLIYNANYPVSPTITAKSLKFSGTGLWGAAIYAMAGTTTINAESIEFDVNKGAIFVNTGAQVILNISKSISSGYANIGDRDDVYIPDGSLTLNMTQPNAKIELGNVRVGYASASAGHDGKLTINNANGTTSLGTVTVTDNLSENATNSSISLTGTTEIRGELTVETDMEAVGNLSLQGETNAIENLSGNVTVDLVEGTQTSVTNNRAKLAIVSSGELNDRVLNGDPNAVAETGLFKITNAGGNETITLQHGLVAPDVTATLNKDGTVNDSSVVMQGNPVQEAASNMAVALPLAVTRTLTNDVRKRMGDLRSANGQHGVWARYDGGKMSDGDGFEHKFNTVQIGIDTIPTADSARLGIAFSYTEGDTEFGDGKSDMDAFSLAAYGTWFAENGLFADVIGRMATVSNDISVYGMGQKYTGKTDNMLLSLSGEVGWRYDLTNLFYVEPQAELTYTYVDGDSFKLGYADYETDSADSLVGRLGFALGVKCPNNKGDAYLRASVVREFLGDSKVSARTPGIDYVFETEAETKDTWFEFGIGVNYNVTPNTYVWADVERTAGGLVDEDWRGTVGVRYSF